MLLHRYFNSHAFETLKDAKLKTARISSFNDPFEFLYVHSVERMTPDLARHFIRSFRSNPDFVLRLFGLSQQLPIPPTEHEIQKRLDESEPLIIANLVKDWPDIANKAELPLARRRQIIDQELRAICFSDPSRVKRRDEILLWSHYAKKHQGIRIGFEFPGGMEERFEIVEMEYREDRVKVNCAFWAETEALKGLEESARVKSKAWEYEWEYRLFIETNLCEPKTIENSHSLSTVEHFLEFKQDWVKTVDFGALCPDTEIQRVVGLLKTDYLKNIIRKKAEFHKTEYALEYREL